MGSELQGKYQKLAQEYAKLRLQVDVLKKAVRDEQSEKSKLEEELREKSLGLRKHIQENESLEFRNQQLSKRVILLQDELDTIKKGGKKKKGTEEVSAGTGSTYDIQAEELAAKIAENEALHSKIADVTQKYETTITGLTERVKNLESEVLSHNAAIEELNKKHRNEVECLKFEKSILDDKIVKLTISLEESQQLISRDQVLRVQASQAQHKPLYTLSDEFQAFNIPAVDTKIQNQLFKSLVVGMDLITTFATQISTFHSYLEQRCKVYPLDTTTGLFLSAENQKLCELLHSSSSYTKPMISTLSSYCEQLEKNPYTLTTSADFEGFAFAYCNFTVFMETLTPYLQLSLQLECRESVCGMQLTALNVQLCHDLLQVSGTLSVVESYVTLITNDLNATLADLWAKTIYRFMMSKLITTLEEMLFENLSESPLISISSNNILLCVEKLHLEFRNVLVSFRALCNTYSAKVTQEYQLPVTNQELNTNNECIVSSLTGICATVEQISDFLERNADLFRNALVHNLGSESQATTIPSVVKKLRVNATHFMQQLQRNCPDTVPYTLAVFNSKSVSSSSESKETLSKQLEASQDRISKLEQEKEQLVLDIHLLKMKNDKEAKKVMTLESQLASQGGSNFQSWVGSQDVTTITNNRDVADEHLREEVIRRHFAVRIGELTAHLQETEGKSVHYYAECRALQKQLLHTCNVKSKMAESLQSVMESNNKLKDELSVTSKNYDNQLSTMSDHLCELNEKLLKQSEELENLKKLKGKRGK